MSFLLHPFRYFRLTLCTLCALRALRKDPQLLITARHLVDRVQEGRDSQIGAVASDQSAPLDSRETFLARYEAARDRFEGK